MGERPVYVWYLTGECMCHAYISVKDYCSHKEQISQVNDFNAFLLMGRCKVLDSLKFFLRYMSDYQRGLFSQGSVPVLSVVWIPLWVFCWSAAAMVDDSTPVELVGEPRPVFYTSYWCLCMCRSIFIKSWVLCHSNIWNERLPYLYSALKT